MLYRVLLAFFLISISKASGDTPVVEAVTIYWVDPWSTGRPVTTAKDVLKLLGFKNSGACEIKIVGDHWLAPLGAMLPKLKVRKKRSLEESIDARVVFRFYTSVKENTYVQLLFSVPNEMQWNELDAPAPSLEEMKVILNLLPKELYDYTVDPVSYEENRKKKVQGPE